MQEENQIIEKELPDMQEEIEKLTKQLSLAKRKTKVLSCFRSGVEGENSPRAGVSEFITVNRFLLGDNWNESTGIKNERIR